MHPHLTHTKSQAHPMQIKRQIKNDVKKNGHVISLKYSHEANMFLSLPTI
jgi:hypothetical protein